MHVAHVPKSYWDLECFLCINIIALFIYIYITLLPNRPFLQPQAKSAHCAKSRVEGDTIIVILVAITPTIFHPLFLLLLLSLSFSFVSLLLSFLLLSFFLSLPPSVLFSFHFCFCHHQSFFLSLSSPFFFHSCFHRPFLPSMFSRSPSLFSSFYHPSLSSFFRSPSYLFSFDSCFRHLSFFLSFSPSLVTFPFILAFIIPLLFPFFLVLPPLSSFISLFLSLSLGLAFPQH